MFGPISATTAAIGGAVLGVGCFTAGFLMGRPSSTDREYIEAGRAAAAAAAAQAAAPAVQAVQAAPAVQAAAPAAAPAPKAKKAA